MTTLLQRLLHRPVCNLDIQKIKTYDKKENGAVSKGGCTIFVRNTGYPKVITEWYIM